MATNKVKKPRVRASSTAQAPKGRAVKRQGRKMKGKKMPWKNAKMMSKEMPCRAC